MRSAQRDIWPFLFFVLTPALCFPWVFIAQGMNEGWDDMYSFMPYLRHSAERALTGDIFWTDTTFLGVPLLPEPEFATFYPLRLLILVGSPITGFSVYVYSHYVLAQATMFIFLRSVGVTRFSAVVGAVAYGLGGFMVSQHIITMYLVAGAWAPLFLYFFGRATGDAYPGTAPTGGASHGTAPTGGALRGTAPVGGALHGAAPTGGAYLGAALSFAMIPFGGSLQHTTYLILMMVVYVLAQSGLTKSLRPILVASLVMIPCGLISALQGLPSIELGGTSALGPRNDFNFFTEMSLHPGGLLYFFSFKSPNWNFFVRMGAVVLCLSAVGIAGVKTTFARVWKIVAAVALLLMFGRHFEPLARLIHITPFISLFRYPIRHAFELNLALCVLAALGLDRLREAGLPGGAKRWFVAVPVVVALITVLALWSAHNPGGMQDILLNDLATIDPIDGIAPALVALFWLWVCTTSVPAVVARRSRITLMVILLETLLALHLAFVGPWPDYRDQLARADFRPKGDKFARVLPYTPPAGIDVLSANFSMLFDGIQQAIADAAVAPADAVEVLGLDFAGFPIDAEDLRWSRVPSVLGVTHVVMPRFVCGDAQIVEEGPNDCTRANGGEPAEINDTFRVCRYQVKGALPSYELVADMWSAEPNAKVSFVVSGNRDDKPVRIEGAFEGSGSDREVVRAGGPVDLRPLPRIIEMHMTAEGIRHASLSDVRWAETSTVNTSSTTPIDGHLQYPMNAEVEIDGTDVWFEDVGDSRTFRFDYRLPGRPLTLRVETEPKTPAAGLLAQRRWDKHPWGRDHAVWGLGAVRTLSFTLSPEADLFDISLVADDGIETLAHQVQVIDACKRRRYRVQKYLGRGLVLYKNKDALPRVYAASRLRTVGSVAHARSIMRNDDAFVPGREALVQDEGELAKTKIAKADVIYSDFKNERVEVRVRAKRRSAFIVVNDRIDEYWRATIDGEPAKIYRTNGIVRGVLVPQGEHTIVMTYAVSPYIWAGLFFALLGALLAWFVMPRVYATRFATSGDAS